MTNDEANSGLWPGTERQAMEHNASEKEQLRTRSWPVRPMSTPTADRGWHSQRRRWRIARPATDRGLGQGRCDGQGWITLTGESAAPGGYCSGLQGLEGIVANEAGDEAKQHIVADDGAEAWMWPAQPATMPNGRLFADCASLNPP
jgi:hypothetical protein